MVMLPNGVTIVADGDTIVDMTNRADPVGVLEVAARLGVKDRTVHKWLQLSGKPDASIRMPDPEYDRVNGSRAWEWSTILRWAGGLGRLRTPDLVNEYTALFGGEPAAARSAGRPLPVTAAQIGEIVTSGESAKDLAERLGVSDAYVFKIRRTERHRLEAVAAADAAAVKKAARKRASAKKKAAAVDLSTNGHGKPRRSGPSVGRTAPRKSRKAKAAVPVS